MKLNEAKVELSEQELLNLLKTKARRSHTAAKQSAMFACFNSAPAYFELAAGSAGSGYIIDKALADLGLSTRSKASVHCYSNAALCQREQEGELYVVLPTDASRIWAAPTDDYYKSFEHAMTELRIKSVSNTNIQEAFAFLGEFETWPQLKQLLQDPEVEKLKGDNHAARIASFKKKPTGLAWFKALFDLDTNGFTMLLPAMPVPAKLELWVDGPAIAINAESYDELHSRGLIK